MQGCFIWLALLAVGVFVMLTLLRWFEQITEAVEQGWWNKIVVLIVFPFGVWFFPSSVVAGRPIPVPHHEPVRGMGTAPKVKTEPTAEPVPPAPAPPFATALDGPPPGTPKEFLGKPIIPPMPKSTNPAIEPDKIAKLRQKMREQGMLKDDADDSAKP